VNGLLDVFIALGFTYKLCWIKSSLNLQYQVEKQSYSQLLEKLNNRKW